MIRKKKEKILFLLLITLTLTAPWFIEITDWLNSLTGKATTNTTQVSITVGNNAPIIYFVNITSTNPSSPIEGGNLAVTFVFNATDIDGTTNLYPGGTPKGYLNYSGTLRSNNSCTYRGTWNSTTVGFSCTVNLIYYDPAATYTVNATIWDSNGASASNITQTFTYQELAAMTMQQPSLNWSTINTTSTNVSADNDPITLNNTGNKNNMIINLTGYSLQGTTFTTEYIYAENFSVHNTTDGCQGVLLANATTKTVPNATLTIGPGISGMEDLYFCLRGIPTTASAQTFNTLPGQSWIVEVI